jgi:hypothetical protein
MINSTRECIFFMFSIEYSSFCKRSARLAERKRPSNGNFARHTKAKFGPPGDVAQSIPILGQICSGRSRTKCGGYRWILSAVHSAAHCSDLRRLCYRIWCFGPAATACMGCICGFLWQPLQTGSFGNSLISRNERTASQDPC